MPAFLGGSVTPWCKILQKQNGPRLWHGPPGGLFGIDQEVVTLRGLFGRLRVPMRLHIGRMQSYSPVSVRAVASDAEASEAPLRATSSKSQPPHLVLDSHYSDYIQNLSFDHLLSGVIADYPKSRVGANSTEVREQGSQQPGSCLELQPFVEQAQRFASVAISPRPSKLASAVTNVRLRTRAVAARNRSAGS